MAHASGLAFQGYKQILHVEAAFFVASIAWVATRVHSGLLAIALGSAFVWLGFMTGKSTYLLLALTFLGLYFGRSILALRRALLRTGVKQNVALSQLIIPLITLIGGVFLWFGFLVIDERTSRYDNDLRLRFYEQRWAEFLDSPLVGKLFQASPSMRIPGSSIYAPSHNDLLDLLALGGITAALPFIILVASTLLARSSVQMFSMRSAEVINQKSSMHWYVLIFGTVALAGNPILAAPSLSLPYLFSIGVVLGLAVQTRTIQKRPHSAMGRKNTLAGAAK